MRTLGAVVRAGLLVAAVGAIGCHSYKKVAVNPDFSSGYPREEIRGSLFASDQAVLSNEDVERILTGQVSLPAKARLAALKLGGYARHASTEHEQIAVDGFMNALGASPRITSASMVPALLVPEKTSIPYLREAAARYQCDLLLVYRVNTGSYYRYRALKSDQAKSYCTVEAVLLDVRTGIVPFTSVAAAEFLAQKDKDSFTFSEAVDAAEQDAAGKALLEVAGDLTKFLNALS